MDEAAAKEPDVGDEEDGAESPRFADGAEDGAPARSPALADGAKEGAPEKPAAAAADFCTGTDIAARRWSAGIVRCSMGRDSHATRFTFIKCCGPILSEVRLPPGEPQPSVIAGNKFVE